MEKKIKLAGIPIEIHTLFDSLIRTEEYETEETPAFTVCTTEADIIAEQRKSMAEAVYEGIPYPEYSPEELENTAVYRKIADNLSEYNGFVFHGSAVAVGEKAYLFTAKSGTGKTTHSLGYYRIIQRTIHGRLVVMAERLFLANGGSMIS